VVLIASQSKAQLPAGYTKVFQDDFDYLNTNNWFVATAYPSKRNRVKVRKSGKNGVLVLENKYFGGMNQQGGRIKSKKTYKYGYFEARVRISKPQNGEIWPAWYLSRHSTCGDPCEATELDIMEYSGYSKASFNNTPASAHHFRQKRKLPGASNKRFDLAASGKNIAQWGIWSCLWTPTQIKMWHTSSNGKVTLIYKSRFAWDAERETTPLELIFSTSPHLNGNNYPDNPNVGGHGPFPNQNLASFEVDWVKVWQKAPFNQVITLRKTGGDRKYVSANKYGDNQLKAKAGNVLDWEKFRVVEHPHGGVALIANSNGKYVQVNGNNKPTPLKAKANPNIPARSWERFNWEEKGNGKVALLSFQTKSYVQAHHKHNNAVIKPLGQRALSYEIFDFKVIGNRTADGRIKLTNKSPKAFVYPNPFNETKSNEIKIDIELPVLTDVSINVFSLSGTKIYSNKYPNLEEGEVTIRFTKEELNIKTKGLYIIKITAGKSSKDLKLLFE